MKVLSILLLLTSLAAQAQGPYSILLETGDTVVTPTYYTKIDSLGYKGGIVAKKDAVLFWTPRERWTFTYPAGRMVKIREKGSSGCVLGRVCAQRFEDYAAEFDSLTIPATWIGDTALVRCYREALAGKGIPTNESGDRASGPDDGMMAEGEGGHGGTMPGEPRQVILRTGDTLFVTKDMYSTDTTVCWFGGGRKHRSDVLLWRSERGQFFFPAAEKGKSRLKKPVPDMSPASKGRLYANILFATGLPWNECGIPDSLRNDTRFTDAYVTEVERLVVVATKRKNRVDALRVAAGTVAGGIIGGVVTGALIKPEDRAYWGSPMPY
jgi:hypothetical protein